MKIDIGCGERPQPGYDVYTDVRQPKASIPGKFYETPMESMPMFSSKQFDYAWCHHVIEHTQEPTKALNELQRIAKRGQINFPSIQIELLAGRSDHRWYVCEDHGRLLIIRKRLGAWQRSVKALQDCKFEWEDTIPFEVVT